MANENLDPSTITPTPGVDPGAPASPPASAEPDAVGSLNQPAAAPPDIDAIKKGMYQAQQEAAELRKRLRDVEPLLEYGKQDKNFFPYLFDKAREYGDPGAGQQIDPSVLSVLNPVLQEARAASETVATWKYHQQMEALAKDFPEFVTDDVKRELSLDAVATGNYDLETHFFRRYGKDLLTKARKQGENTAVKKIQENNQLYVNGSPTTPFAPPANIATMNEEEKKKWLEAEFDKILSDKEYERKVASQVTG